MTLTPNYLLAFVKTFLWFFAFIAVSSGVVAYLQGNEVRVGNILALATLGGTLFGIFVTAIFTPREITWDDETIKIRAIFPRSGDFEWRQLEAWSPYGRGTLLIKFNDGQAFQIAPAGFGSKDWKVFRSMLQQRFPEKKTLIWIGVRPVRFRKKDGT
ncbi:MAG TPA: hypothetical protein VN887_18365 [Candidatus Angelobacter sp.]|nr:hypothetical protein [Candidatus Angelobacter sp.]